VSTLRQALALSLVVALLSGCALSDKLREVAESVRSNRQRITTAQEGFVAATTDIEVRRAAQQVDRPWLAGRAQPLAREATLPPALRADVNTTLIFSGEALSLPAIAQRLTLATGIPVHVRPEALLPLERFAPKLAGGRQTSDTTTAPAAMHLRGGPAPLVQTLDRIGARLGVSWRYVADRIEFYRTETRVFNVRALTLNASAEASLGSKRTGHADGFASTSRTSLEANGLDVMDIVRARIEPFLSQAGNMVAQAGASSSIVVTDTPDVLQGIASYLDKENQALTRRVRLVFEELTLSTHDTAEAAVDWNVVFASARIAASAVMPVNGLEQAASVGIGIQDGPFRGSEAMIKALGQVGQVVRRSTLPVLTLNRRPVSHAVRTTFSYIDRVETTSIPDGVGTALPTVSISQKEETVGSLLTVVPDAQEDGQILLSVAYDNTVAQPLKSITFGDRANPLQLQQITIDGNGTVQQVALYPGQPLVISGFDRIQDESDQRRLNPGFPVALGGSDRAGSQHLTTIMLVTAHVEEGF